MSIQSSEVATSISIHLRDTTQLHGHVRNAEDLDQPWVSIEAGRQSITFFVADKVQRRVLGDMLIGLGQALVTRRVVEYDA